MARRDVAQPDPWDHLRRATPARIALGRAGGSVPTRELLDFQLAHARARDAVHAPFDAAALAREVEPLGLTTVILRSAAADRPTYLRRPDLGRRLDEPSRLVLERSASQQADLAVIVSDGLSALAAHRHAAPLLAALLPLVRRSGWSIAPVCVVTHARVALQDQVGSLLRARVALILLGERPGLGSPDSLGAYFVYGPAPGKTDADRNCISNIRPEGLPPEAAATKLHRLLSEALTRLISGVALKDETPALGPSATRTLG